MPLLRWFVFASCAAAAVVGVLRCCAGKLLLAAPLHRCFDGHQMRRCCAGLGSALLCWLVFASCVAAALVSVCQLRRRGSGWGSALLRWLDVAGCGTAALVCVRQLRRHSAVSTEADSIARPGHEADAGTG